MVSLSLAILVLPVRKPRSFPRKRVSSLCGPWVPAFAGTNGRTGFPRCFFIYRQIIPQHDAVSLPRGLARHQLLAHVGANQLRIALERIAPAAAATSAHDRGGFRRHGDVRTDHHLEIVLAGTLKK